MDFRSYLQTTAQEINQEIEHFLKNWNQEVGEISVSLSPLTQSFIDACEGGKRLRGVLVKLGYELTRDSSRPKAHQNDREILKPAAAFEIFQTAILAHDDIIDLSPLRRGKQTLYQALGGDHYGISQTICLGDIGFFLATQLINHSTFSEDKKNKALGFFSKMVINTALGEMLDVQLPYLQKERVEQDVLMIHKLKTADYTIVNPLQLGVILGGGDEKLLKNLAEFGENLGIAFQVQDDILGVFGSEKELGKSVTSDIEEGKNTLLIMYALKNGSNEQKEILNQYYGQGKIDDHGLEQVKKVFEDSGSLEYSQKRAEEMVKKAKSLIPTISSNPEHIKLLAEMADFLVKRKS